MPMPTDPVDGASPSEAEPIQPTAPAPSAAPAPLALVREVQGPTSDRGRVAGLAMVCSAAGVALGFALAGSLFAAMAPPPASVGPAGWSSCPGHRAYAHLDPGYHYHHQAPRPWLGVTLNVPDDRAPAVLAGVFAGAPAAEAGLRAGDRVTRFDGEAIDSATELLGLIRAHHPGDAVSIEAITHDGRPVSIPSLHLDRMPLP